MSVKHVFETQNTSYSSRSRQQQNEQDQPPDPNVAILLLAHEAYSSAARLGFFCQMLKENYDMEFFDDDSMGLIIKGRKSEIARKLEEKKQAEAEKKRQEELRKKAKKAQDSKASGKDKKNQSSKKGKKKDEDDPKDPYDDIGEDVWKQAENENKDLSEQLEQSRISRNLPIVFNEKFFLSNLCILIFFCFSSIY